MDEYIRGGTMFYRVSDKGYDNENVKDTTLHTKFGDLSDGNNFVLSVKSGTDSTIAVLDFQVTPPPYFDNNADLAGFDFNFVNVLESESDVGGAAGAFDVHKPLSNCNIYLMKDGNVIENEGDMSIINKDGKDFDYYLSEQGEELTQGTRFIRDNMAVFLANQHFESSSLCYTEMFSQTSDVNVNKHTTQGVVAETKTPYIELNVAHKKRNLLTKGVSYDIMKAFYSTVHTDGKNIVPIGPAKDDNEFPPDKWKAAAAKGEKGSIMGGMVGEGLKSGGLGFLTNLPALQTTGAYSMGAIKSPGNFVPEGSKLKNLKTSLSLRNQAGAASVARGTAYQNGFRSLTKLGPAGKVLGPISVGVGMYDGWMKGAERKDAIKAAQKSGDFSGVKRPTFDPTWKNKKIKGDIKYAIEKEYGTTFQLDENAVTATSSWWDKVKEVRDYEKLETHLAGFSSAESEDQSYGSDEEKLAKSSINFVTGKEGNCMHMMCYTDYDTSQAAHSQPSLDFSANGLNDAGDTILRRPLQQDIYVSKYNLPRPAQFFQNNVGGGSTGNYKIGVGNINDGNSVAGKDPTDSYELSFDMMVGELPVPYAILYNDAGDGTAGSTIKPVFRRGIAVTFSQKKPKDNESFYDYVYRHTDDTGAANYNSRIMGWVIEKELSFTGGQATFGTTICIPIAERTGVLDTNHSVNLFRTAAGNTDSNLLDLVTLPARGVEIPSSTWLRFKMSTNLHGGSGKASSKRARAYLTIHDSSTGEIIDAQKTGGENEGPIELLSPYPECATDWVSPVLNDTNPMNKDGEWMPHMTIWVVNHRYNCGSNMDEMGDRQVTSGEATNNDYFLHDYFQKAAQKGAVGFNTLNSNAIKADPYELAKTECWVDNMYIRGAECKITNMSVNEENPTNIPSNNCINNDDVFATINAPIGGGDPVTTTAPTVIAMGFETTTNIAGGLDNNAKYLLFNDFWADNDPCLPLENNGPKDKGEGDRHDLYAGYSKGLEKAGDWIDSYTTTTVDSGINTDENLTSSESSPTQFDVTPNLYDALNNGDIIKVGNEKMEITALSGTVITAKRAQYGTTQGNHTSGSNIHIVGQSNFKNLTIGHNYQNGYTQVEPDIKIAATKTAQEQAYDKDTSGKIYVEGFSRKGIVQVQNAMTGWVRRECIYASTRIVGLGNKDDHDVESVSINNANIQVGNPSIFNFKKGVDGEKYIIYRYGSTLNFAANGNAAIVTVDNTGDFIKIRRHAATDLGSGNKGTRLNALLNSNNLTDLFICPWRYWLCIATDAMDKSLEQNPLYLNSPDEDMDIAKPGERGYGSICSIKGPVFSNATTSTGFDVGTTFNESRFTTADLKERTFDIGPEAAYETELDFGHGAYDLELSSGGEVTRFQGQYASNRVNLDGILNGLTPSGGDIISLCISANDANSRDSELHFWSGDFTANAHDMPKRDSDALPQLITKYVVATPPSPGIAVRPNENNPLYPEFHYAVDTQNLWYGYLLVSENDITNKYHGITAYAPLNENCDKPWLGKPSLKRGGDANTLKKMKLYGSEEAIGRDDLGLAGQGDHKLVYATDTGAYDGTFSGQQTANNTSRQTVEGLAGRAFDSRDEGTITFPYVGGKSMSLGGRDKLSVVLHVTSGSGASDGTMLEIGTDECISIKQTGGKAVVRLYKGGSDYIELTSISSMPKDNITPTCIIFTFDKQLLNANCKLYINGKLEDQSGSLKPAHSTANKEWQYDTSFASGTSHDMVIGNYNGIYEEILFYDKVILPIEFDEDRSSITLERNLEEIMTIGSGQYNNGNGIPQTWNARLFVFDYHNLRGNAVSASPQVSWRKTSFPIDGRSE